MKVKLYMFSGSHSVRTAELMLEHKGIADYQRRNMLPGVHAVIMLLTGFETMTVPALKSTVAASRGPSRSHGRWMS